MSSRKMVQLRNGAVFDLDDVKVITRAELNDYRIILRELPQGPYPKADHTDVEFIIEMLGDTLMTVPTITEVKESEPIIKSKLAKED